MKRPSYEKSLKESANRKGLSLVTVDAAGMFMQVALSKEDAIKLREFAFELYQKEITESEVSE